MMSGAAGGDALDVDDVFSTYLYTGDATSSSSRSISNGIDLDGEGGLVWIKRRGASWEHSLYDSERSLVEHLSTNNANPSQSDSFDLSGDKMQSFNSDGFNVGNLLNSFYHGDYASWTFRKAPKFFDIVTYTGNGTSGRTISHNLGCEVGMMVIKDLNNSNSWVTYHRGVGATKYLELNGNSNGLTASWMFNNTAPTSSVFTLGNNVAVNYSGREYIAYLFAHNDGDGEFGPDGDQDIIKCGGYTGDGSSGGPEIDVGFEPQWVMIKRTDGTGDWLIMDSIRGIHTNKEEPFLIANGSQAESNAEKIRLLGNGFKIDTADSSVNAQTGKYIYVAIRRGPVSVPEDASDVFNVSTRGNGYYGYLGKPVDLWMNRETGTSYMYFRDRLRGGWYLTNQANTTEAEGGGDWYANNEGAFPTSGTSSAMISYTWRRAPSFFDVLAYKGSNSALTLDHNLRVAPEMVWIKARNSASSNDWFCWHKDLSSIGNSTYPNLSLTSHIGGYFNGNMSPTVSASSITIPSNVYISNQSYEYVAYLFATAPGVSKVGSYTGNGNSGRVIDCGFSAGAKFVLIKRTNANGDWYLFDTVRGINTGNDPYFLLNADSPQNPNLDSIDPHSSGFIINAIGTALNASGATYIFYAIA